MMKDYYQADGSLNLAAIEAEAHRLRAETFAGFVRHLFGGFKTAPAAHQKPV